MKDRKFERLCANKLYDNSYWALNIPKNSAGAQPFDLIAMKDTKICAYDCKVISSNIASFPFSRIEYNQRSSFEEITLKVITEEVGLLIYFMEEIYFVSWDKIKNLEARGEKSIKLRKELLWLKQDDGNCFR